MDLGDLGLSEEELAALGDLDDEVTAALDEALADAEAAIEAAEEAAGDYEGDWDQDWSAGGLDSLPFEVPDLSLDALGDLDIDASACATLNLAAIDEDALKECLEALEAGVKGLDYSQLTEEAWAAFKEEADEWDQAVEVADIVDLDLATLADDVVTDVATVLEEGVESSSLIDADTWYAVYEDFEAGAFNDIDLSAVEEQAAELAAVPEDFLEALEDNDDIEDALEELEELVGEDFDGTAIEAIAGDEAVAEAWEAIEEADEVTEAQLEALRDAIADSEVASAEFDKIFAAANTIADEIISEAETTVEDALTEQVPALLDAVDAAMPDSVDAMVADVWSEGAEALEKVSTSGSATAVRAALQEQLDEVEEVLGDGMTSLIDKSEAFGESVSAATAELAAEQGGDDGAFHFTASIAAALAMVHVLAF